MNQRLPVASRLDYSSQETVAPSRGSSLASNTTSVQHRCPWTMTTLKFSLHGQSFHVHRKTLCNQSSLFSWILTPCGTSRLAQLSPWTNSVKAISSTRYTLNSTYWASCFFVAYSEQESYLSSTEALIKQNSPLQTIGVAVSLLLLPQEKAKVVYCFHSADVQIAAWSGSAVARCSRWDCPCSW